MRYVVCLTAILAITAHATAVDPDRASVGRLIFFDASLSADGKTSCTTCHDPNHAFAGTTSVGIGVDQRKGTRNAPSLIGVGEQRSFFWDGRREKIADAVLDPFTNAADLGLQSDDELLRKIAQTPYASRLRRQCGSLNRHCVAQALTSFLQSLDATDQDTRPLTKQQALGRALFINAGCNECHLLRGNIPTSDGKFHHAGVGTLTAEEMAKVVIKFAADPPAASELGRVISLDAATAELGRFAVTKQPTDIAAFQTPSLRNVSLTAPYMHDGSIPTLEEAVAHEIYYRGFSKAQPISLSGEERREILEFLKGNASNAFD